MLECPRRECHRRSFGTLALELHEFVHHFATPFENIIAMILGGGPLPFMAQLILQ
jgi:hypothetical protein